VTAPIPPTTRPRRALALLPLLFAGVLGAGAEHLHHRYITQRLLTLQDTTVHLAWDILADARDYRRQLLVCQGVVPDSVLTTPRTPEVPRAPLRRQPARSLLRAAYRR
jgi:hypothetical protein